MEDAKQRATLTISERPERLWCTDALLGKGELPGGLGRRRRIVICSLKPCWIMRTRNGLPLAETSGLNRGTEFRVRCISAMVRSRVQARKLIDIGALETSELDSLVATSSRLKCELG